MKLIPLFDAVFPGLVTGYAAEPRSDAEWEAYYARAEQRRIERLQRQDEDGDDDGQTRGMPQ